MSWDCRESLHGYSSRPRARESLSLFLASTRLLPIDTSMGAVYVSPRMVCHIFHTDCCLLRLFCRGLSINQVSRVRGRRTAEDLVSCIRLIRLFLSSSLPHASLSSCKARSSQAYRYRLGCDGCVGCDGRLVGAAPSKLGKLRAIVMRD